MIEGYVPPPGTNAKGDWQIVTTGYLEAMGEQVIRGRGIADDDTSETPARDVDQRGDGEAVLVRARSDRQPLAIGMRPDRPWVTVVGIVK